MKMKDLKVYDEDRKIIIDYKGNKYNYSKDYYNYQKGYIIRKKDKKIILDVNKLFNDIIYKDIMTNIS